MVIDCVEDEKIVKVKPSAERSVSVQGDVPALPALRAIRSLRVAHRWMVIVNDSEMLSRELLSEHVLPRALGLDPVLM